LAARRWLSCCRAFQACRIRWLRMVSRTVVISISGARPVRRHQPRLVPLAAGSLAVAKPRSALGAAGVGAAVRGGGVVVSLRGLGVIL
jgi:hypothetical protein